MKKAPRPRRRPAVKKAPGQEGARRPRRRAGQEGGRAPAKAAARRRPSRCASRVEAAKVAAKGGGREAAVTSPGPTRGRRACAEAAQAHGGPLRERRQVPGGAARSFCSKSARSTRARPMTCGPRPSRWPSTGSRATSSSTRSRARAERWPSTASGTSPCRLRPWPPSTRSTSRSAPIETKMYGACENCGQPIPKARLRALPYARLCVACKSGGLHRR